MKGLRPIIIQDLRESCKSIRTKYSFSPSSFIPFDSLLLTEWLMLLFFFSFSDKWSWWSRLRFHQRPRTCSPFSSFFFVPLILLSYSFLPSCRKDSADCFIFSLSYPEECVCISASVSVCTLWMSSNPVGYIPDSLLFFCLSFLPRHSHMYTLFFFLMWFCLAICLFKYYKEKVMRSLFPRPEWSGQNLFMLSCRPLSLSLLFPHERVSHILIRLYCVVTGSITLSALTDRRAGAGKDGWRIGMSVEKRQRPLLFIIKMIWINFFVLTILQLLLFFSLFVYTESRYVHLVTRKRRIRCCFLSSTS